MQNLLPATVQLLTCDNPSPMTLEGTNTYLIGDPGADEVVVVDPGPEGHPEHVRAVVSAAGRRTVTQILLTHRHRDHRGAAGLLAEMTGAAVRGLDSEICTTAGDCTVTPLADQETITAGGTAVTVLHTPGHTSDSVCFWLPETRAMLTGDTVLGRGTTMLDYPDGTLSDYLTTLDTLSEYDDAALLPAHGPVHERMGPVLAEYIQHRHQRLDEVRRLLAEHGELTAEQLGHLLYGENPAVHPGVIAKVAAAQLSHLQGT